MSKIFIDTWGWLSLLDSRDIRHKAVVACLKNLQKDKFQLFTTDYILDETFTLLFKRLDFDIAWQAKERIMGLEDLSIEKITENRFEKSMQFRKKFKDKPDISFTDLTSFVVMQECNIHLILTEDKHFKKINLGFTLVP